MDRPPLGKRPRVTAQTRLMALQSDIMDLILERKLDVGDPLPTEIELAEVLGVGRNTLRESLKVLQALGVIEIRHGFGMFVAPTNFESLAAGLAFRGRLSLEHGTAEALQLVDIRQALESGLIGAAMDLMVPEHLQALEDTVRSMEELAAQGEDFAEADAAFHRALFAPLNNELLSNLMSLFWTVYSDIYAEVKDTNLFETAAVHRGICEAVAAGDKSLAAERLVRHFDGIRRRIGELTGPAN